MDELIGYVAVSKAGRDKNKLFIIIGQEEDNYCFLADGRLRKIEAPKKKKRKHLYITDIFLDEIHAKIHSGDKIGNAEFRKIISGLEIV